jgi:hypothetical protein
LLLLLHFIHFFRTAVDARESWWGASWGANLKATGDAPHRGAQVRHCAVTNEMLCQASMEEED